MLLASSLVVLRPPSSVALSSLLALDAVFFYDRFSSPRDERRKVDGQTEHTHGGDNDDRRCSRAS